MTRCLGSRVLPSAAALVAVSLLLAVSTSSCSKGKPSPDGQPAAALGEHKEQAVLEMNPSTVPAVGPALKGTVSLKIGAGSKLSGPRGIALDKQGNLYVADVENHRIVKFDATGREVMEIGRVGTGPSEFKAPWRVSVAPQGNILVLDPVLQYVLAYSPEGKFVSRFGGASVGLYSPGGLAVTADGTPCVADTGGGKIVLLGPEGKPPILSITKVGKEALRQPPEVAVDSAGNFWFLSLGVKDNKGQLMKTTPAGELIAQWTVIGIPSTRDTPRMVVAPDGRIVMTDPESRRVVVFSADMSKMRPVAMSEGPFKLLTGIAMDGQGRFYVADAEANLIYRFEIEKGD
jgi:tripartite motif-containing protein 71